MSFRPVVHGSAVALIVALLAMTASAGTFVQPLVSGTTPSGKQWSAVATGTALPIRTSGTNPLNGSPGAVVYFDTTTGQIQFDPKGLSITAFSLTYTTGTVNISGTTPGPFQYSTGTSTAAFSDITGTARTFPAVTALTGLAPTTFPARVGMTVGPPLSVTLNTGTNPNSASTNGFWNLPWAFPTDLVNSGSVATMALCFTGSGQNYFRTVGQGSNLNANVLGFGSQQGVFQYLVNGITGNQVGAVIPVQMVPEPSAVALAGVGLAAAVGCRWRRRNRRHPAAGGQDRVAPVG